jgi:hypothetical protein
MKEGRKRPASSLNLTGRWDRPPLRLAVAPQCGGVPGPSVSSAVRPYRVGPSPMIPAAKLRRRHGLARVFVFLLPVR